MTDPEDTYDRLNKAFNLDDLARYDANQAEVFRKVVHQMRDLVPGGYEVDLEGLVELVRNLVPLEAPEYFFAELENEIEALTAKNTELMALLDTDTLLMNNIIAEIEGLRAENMILRAALLRHQDSLIPGMPKFAAIAQVEKPPQLAIERFNELTKDDPPDRMGLPARMTP